MHKVTSRTKGEAVISTWKETWRARDGEKTLLEIVATMSDMFEEETFHKVVPVFAWKLDAFASPNGETVVPFITQSFSNVRLGSVSTLLPLEAKKAP